MEQKKTRSDKDITQKLNDLLLKVDGLSLIWMAVPLLLVFFLYFFLLGKNCVFEINDQLDETLFTYVLNAKYLFSGVKNYPEMLGGVPKGGMSVSACLFIPLYKLFPVFWAFMIQYIIVVATAYAGMYLCVKELTESSIIGVLCGGMFMFLPYQPVYGLSVVGGPLVFYAFLCLYRRKHVIIDGLLILYFALGANLVLLGYVALGLVLAADIWILIEWLRKDRYLPESGRTQDGRRQMRAEAGMQEQPGTKAEIRKRNKYFMLGSLELLLVYMVVNLSLFSELLLGNGGYVSHREEMVITGNSDFWGCVKDVFLNSGQHALSFHQRLIVPVLLVIVCYAFRWRVWKCMGDFRRKDEEKDAGAEKGEIKAKTEGIRTEENAGRTKVDIDAACAEKAVLCCNMYIWLVMIFMINILAALFYGFCQSGFVVDFRNSVSGFFHYFSPQRVYWIFPTTWYVAVGLSAGLIWKDYGFFGKKKLLGNILAGGLICIMLIPTAWHIRQNSIWILNKSQYKNNCNVGLMSWADYFAEDLMQEIEAAIFEETEQVQEEYRVASLGMCPAVALEAGFYCIDGYSNNYSLEYKHEFRKIIEEELEKCPSMKGYFDDWGSRCYLFTEESQNYYYLVKGADFQYQKLKLNVGKMKELGCEYLFSAAEIEEENAGRLGLELFGVFETGESYYRIWVYSL